MRILTLRCHSYGVAGPIGATSTVATTVVCRALVAWRGEPFGERHRLDKEQLQRLRQLCRDQLPDRQHSGSGLQAPFRAGAFLHPTGVGGICARRPGRRIRGTDGSHCATAHFSGPQDVASPLQPAFIGCRCEVVCATMSGRCPRTVHQPTETTAAPGAIRHMSPRRILDGRLVAKTRRTQALSTELTSRRQSGRIPSGEPTHVAGTLPAARRSGVKKHSGVIKARDSMRRGRLDGEHSLDIRRDARYERNHAGRNISKSTSEAL